MFKKKVSKIIKLIYKRSKSGNGDFSKIGPVYSG